MKLSVLSEHAAGAPFTIDEGLFGLGRSANKTVIPPRYWQKIDPRVIKTLVTAITMDDIKWALGQIATILDPSDLNIYKAALKADAKGTLAVIRKEAEQVMISYGRNTSRDGGHRMAM